MSIHDEDDVEIGRVFLRHVNEEDEILCKKLQRLSILVVCLMSKCTIEVSLASEGVNAIGCAILTPFQGSKSPGCLDWLQDDY